ncbi:hypothetical protein, partial [Phyllobacterium sp. SYP-B3895]|uniref:hypothetical protein n=1 Tax=Phyllobacterium sp. SYP-B3895 TaxID=2663240 RepID=UPI001AF01A2F
MASTTVNKPVPTGTNSTLRSNPKECHFRNNPLNLAKDRLHQHVSLATNHHANLRAHSATASGAPPSLCRYIDP